MAEALADSVNPKQYIKRMRSRDEDYHLNQGTLCILVQMIVEDDKKNKIQAVYIKGLFRIIQSISSSKTEPFKLWLAQVGYEYVQEIENLEFAQGRMKKLLRIGLPDVDVV